MTSISTSGVYAFWNRLTGMMYVGQAANLRRRKGEHLRELRKGNHKNAHFQHAFSKYGEDAFLYVVLEECSRERLNDSEQRYLNDMAMLYNKSPVAQANGAGRRDEETRRRIAIAIAKAKAADPTIVARQAESLRKLHAERPEIMAALSAKNLGRKHSADECVRRNSAIRQVRSTDESRKKTSEKSREMWGRDGFKDAHAKSMLSALTCDVIERRNKAIRESKQKRFADPDYRAAISEKLKAAWAARKANQRSTT